MGSGSSKAGAQPRDKKRQPPSVRTVANVNNEDSSPGKGKPDTKNDERGAPKEPENRNLKTLSVEQNRGEQNMISSDIKVEKQQQVEKETFKNKKQSKQNDKNSKPVPNLLQFEEDSDLDDDIDAVLKIPMATDNSRQSRDKSKKNKKEKDKENIDNRNYNNNFNDYPSHERNLSSERTEDVPETYAQRLQRQQYKLQQNMLLREKTIVRDSRDWRNEESEDEDEQESRGFDASKFRQANQGGGPKKEIFTTAMQEDLQTPRYLQTSGKDLDEVDVDRGRYDASPRRDLPRYNQSELDLMRQLEEEIL